MKIGYLISTATFFSLFLPCISQPVMAQDYEQLPVLQDGQQLSTPVSIAATSGMSGNTPVVITLETRSYWCYGRVFLPNGPQCLEQIGGGDLIRTTWSIDCRNHQVQESSELTDDEIVQVDFANFSKATQQAYRVYAYACGAE
jgi:hypothetical protein